MSGGEVAPSVEKAGIVPIYKPGEESPESSSPGFSLKSPGGKTVESQSPREELKRH